MKFKGIFILLAFASMLLVGCKKDENGTISTADNPGQKTVIVYGAPWCSSCEGLKEQLNDNNIEFQSQNTDNSDVDQALKAKLVNGGFINEGEDYPIPVVEVDGEILFASQANLANIQARL